MKTFIKTLIISLLSISTFAQQASEIDPKFVKLPRYADLTAINAAINTPTQGMMVYNIGTASNWYYNGTTWTNTAGSLALPYSQTLANGNPLFDLVNTGGGWSGRFEINNTSNFRDAIYALTNGNGNAVRGLNNGSGGAGYFQIGNANSYATALSAVTVGNYDAGYFGIDNALNIGQAISAQTNGIGSAGLFQINNALSSNHTLIVNTNGLGRSGWFQSTNTLNNAASLIAENYGLGQGVYGTNFGTGKAGVFEINNSLNTNIALHAFTNGNGDSFYSYTGGLGKAGVFEINNASNNSIALRAFTSGLGRAGSFSINNASNNSAALLGESIGTAQAVYGAMLGTGKAGVFEVNNASNTNIALHAFTNGTGKAAYFQGTNALETDGTVKFGGSGVGTPATGKVLTATDAFGNATWQAIPAVAAPLSLSSTATTLTATSTVGTAANFSSTSGYALITGTGNVGIGKSTPTAKLDVYNDSPPHLAYSAIIGDNPIGGQLVSVGVIGVASSTNPTPPVSTATSTVGVLGENLSTNTYGSGVLGTHAGGGNGVKGTSISGNGGYFSSTSGYALITGTGNVGIGKSTPTAKLDVYNDSPPHLAYSAIIGDNPIGGQLVSVGVIGVASSTNPTPPVSTATSTVGVLGENLSTNTYGSGVLGTHAGGGNGVKGTSISGNGGYFSSTSGYALTTGTGNVGIGTPTPTTKLHVFTNAAGTEATFSENNGTGNAIGVKGSVTNAAASGVGIWGVHAGGGKGVQGESNSGIGGYFSSTSGYALTTGTGNVGIGTPTPAAKLDVAGYTKLGDDATAPKIKMKELAVFNSAATYNGQSPQAHGLTASKIISVSVLLEWTTGYFVPVEYSSDVNLRYNYFISPTEIIVQNNTPGPTCPYICGKPVKVLITYKE